MSCVRIVLMTLGAIFVAAPGILFGAGGSRQVVPYQEGQAIRLSADLGGVRATELRITPDQQRMTDPLLPPHGGQSRFSWRRYDLHLENSTGERKRVKVLLRLLDGSGAVIDEFRLEGSISKGRTKKISLRRLTLNYAVPLIAKVEVSLEAE